MKQCVILTIDNNLDEPEYQKMILLLVKSIRLFNKNIPIFIGIFTNRIISDEIINQLKIYNCNIIIDILFNTLEHDINYFLRNFCKFYFSHINNLLKEFDQLIYSDIDVILLDDIAKIILNEDEILVEEVPENIKLLEEQYIGKINHPLYYNWIDVITRSNNHIFNLDYGNMMHLKESDIAISKNINKNHLTIINQSIGAYYPKHKLTNTSIAFHYDGFIDSGTFWKLEEHNKKLYNNLKIYIEKVLKIIIDNNKEYWNE